MKNIGIKLSILAICIVLVSCAMTFIGQVTNDKIDIAPNSLASNVQSDLLQKPIWNVGDWWTIEEADQQITISMPNPTWINYTVNMVVKDIEKINGEDCYRVESTSTFDQVDRLRSNPPKIIFYRLSNLSIARIEEPVSSPKGLSYMVYDGDKVKNAMSPQIYLTPAFPSVGSLKRASEVSFNLPGTSSINTTISSKLAQDNQNINYLKFDIGKTNGYNVSQIWSQKTPFWLYDDEEYTKAKLVDCSWWH